MTETISLSHFFAPTRGCNFTYEMLIRDRIPSAVSEIAIDAGEISIGKIEFYSTPMGTVINAVIDSMPYESNDYEPLFIEIDGKRNHPVRSPSYRLKTANLPPIFVKKGLGSVAFMTDRFSALDIIGRRIFVKKSGRNFASGKIIGAADKAND